MVRSALLLPSHLDFQSPKPGPIPPCGERGLHQVEFHEATRAGSLRTLPSVGMRIPGCTSTRAVKAMPTPVQSPASKAGPHILRGFAEGHCSWGCEFPGQNLHRLGCE